MNLLDSKVQTFLEVVQSGSFSKAAEALYVSPVSVMKQINSLESQMGFDLFERTHTGVAPTKAGIVLAQRLKSITSSCNAAIAEAQQEANQAKRVIRVGTSLLRPCRPLVNLCSRAGSNFPFRIEIVPFDDEQENLRTTMLKLGSSIDCLVGPFDLRGWAKYGTLNFLKLIDVPCCIGIPLGHPLRGKQSLTWNDLEGKRLILVREGESSIIDSIRSDIASNHPGIHIVDTPFFYGPEIFNECSASGILMETLSIWSDAHPSIETAPMEWNYTIPFGIIYPSNPTEAVSDFVNFIDDLQKTESLR